MLVTTYPNCELAERVGPLADVDVLVWDWRTGPSASDVSTTNFLVSDYSAEPPTADDLSPLAHLLAVQLPSAGFDGWLASLPDGVALCNGRALHGQSTAEAAVTGVLALLRSVPAAVAQRSHEIWSPVPVQLLSGRRVLVVGAGDIGSRIARLFDAFECPVTVVGRSARPGVRSVDDLAALVVDADVVVLAVPLTPSTRGLVDAALLARLPDGGIVVNVARGAVVDTEALADEVTTGRVRAYLDVTDPEPLPTGHRLWHLPGVLLTPHGGGGEQGWLDRYADLIRDQICRLRDGHSLRNVVTP